MTTAAALIAGLATSLHCAGMCGPIACGLGTLAKSEGERLAAASLYHASRLVSYAVVGAVCGALGRQPLEWFFDSPAVVLPWVLVAVLVMMALGLDRKVPRPAVLSWWMTKLRLRIGRFHACGASAAMGLLTPFLPCGPLYLVFGAALLAGSAAKGAEFSLAFGLGTVPLLWLAQHQFHRIRARLSPAAMTQLRRGLALTAALLLAWRLHDTLPLPWSSPSGKADGTGGDLPSCCH
jgi:sulfite exporter TauE/SafE